jgi:DNA-binding NarL/FixJ family response regulator
MLTTSSDEKDLIACYEAGANAYVVKPDGLEVLCDALRKIHDFWTLSMTPSG